MSINSPKISGKGIRLLSNEIIFKFFIVDNFSPQNANNNKYNGPSHISVYNNNNNNYRDDDERYTFKNMSNEIDSISKNSKKQTSSPPQR